MWKALLLIFLAFRTIYGAEDYPQSPKESPTPEELQQSPQKPGVKDYPAAGKYYGGGKDHDRGYDHGYGHGHHKKTYRGYDVPLIDDYICDLDATILVVTNADDSPSYEKHADKPAHDKPAYEKPHDKPAYEKPAYEKTEKDNEYDERVKREAYGHDNYGHHRGGHDRGYDRHDRDYSREHDYGRDYDRDDYSHDHGYHAPLANADRLRCSVIAANSEDSCTTCCQLSARRDRSIGKDRIIGFLVDNNQINYETDAKDGNDDGQGYARMKRSNNYAKPAAAPAMPAYEKPTEAPIVEAPEAEADNRCVCCAPKRYRPLPFFDFHHRKHHRGGY